MNNTVKLLKASESPIGIKLYTFELTYWRALHPELCRHRSMSRTVESSRAKPIQKNIDEVKNNPFIPDHWSINGPGMVAKAYETDPNKILGYRNAVRMMAQGAAAMAEQLAALGLHKQIVNRYLEPYLFTKEVVTTTDIALNHFFDLRLAPDAEPHVQDLARNIKETVEKYTPELLPFGSWHLPYIREEDEELIEEYIRANDLKMEPEVILGIKKSVSAARCARCSYKAFDGSTSIEKDLGLFEKLLTGKHCYDAQTEVLTKKGWKFFKDVTYLDEIVDIDANTGQFVGFSTPLDIIAKKYTGKMYSVDTRNISFRVTNNHRMFGQIITKANTRYSTFKPEIFLPEEKSKHKSSKNINIFRECRMTSVPLLQKELIPSNWGKLIGFYIGDGYKSKKQVIFHIKKERKISYISFILNALNIPFKTSKPDSSGAVRISIKDWNISAYLANNHGNSSRTKRIGEIYDQETLLGIFDGLKNSDGHLHRKTWIYATMSEQLKNDILNKAPLISKTLTWRQDTKTNCFILSFRTKTEIHINDSRKPKSYVFEEFVINEPVYCVTVPHGALVVRRNGQTLVCGNCSPMEHPCSPDSTTDTGAWAHPDHHGNSFGWIQYRKEIENKYRLGM